MKARLLLALLAAGLLAPGLRSQVLWRADSTWAPGAEGSLLSVGAGSWELKSPTLVDVVRVGPGGLIQLPAHALNEGEKASLAVNLPMPLEEAYLGATVRVLSASRGLRSAIQFSASGYSRSIVSFAKTPDDQIRLSVSSQGGKGDEGPHPVAPIGERFRVVAQFSASKPARLWAARLGEGPHPEQPYAVASKTTNGSPVNQIELRLQADLAYEVSDLVVAGSLAEAWAPR